MSTRERNLLILLVSMAFIGVNFVAYNMWYQPKMKAMQNARKAAESQVKFNEFEASLGSDVEAERAWLERFEPEPSSIGRMKTKIQQLAENEAIRAGLQVKRKDFGTDVIDPSLTYHRARFQIEVNGIESSIYRWLDRLHNPNEFRAVTYVRLNPQRDDNTRADAEVYLDQWFVPESTES